MTFLNPKAVKDTYGNLLKQNFERLYLKRYEYVEPTIEKAIQGAGDTFVNGFLSIFSVNFLLAIGM